MTDEDYPRLTRFMESLEFEEVPLFSKEKIIRLVRQSKKGQ